MSANPIRLQTLFRKYLRGNITPSEQQEFWELMADYDDKDLLEVELKVLWEKEQPVIRPSDSVNWKRVENRLATMIKNSEINYDRFKPRRLIPAWTKYAAAAIIIGVMVFVGKQWINNQPEQQAITAQTDIPAPDKSRAMITLADGKTILYLDQIKNGSSVVAQNGLIVRKAADGSVQYESNGAATDQAIAYNTFSNPRGSKAQKLVLDDGTAIWLNAGSSFRYPLAFVEGKPRHAELLEGEAFLEVKHDEKSPFTLKVGSELIEDLGTSFNVNAYTSGNIKTTLVDGALRVNAKAIQPGEQYQNGIITKPEMEQVVAWKNGQFNFNESSVDEILKQAAVWYDIEILMEGKVNERFSFSVDRSKPVSALLKAMELSGGVHFEIEGRKVYVRP